MQKANLISISKLLKIFVSFNKQISIPSLFDSGSQCTIIHESLSNQLNLTIMPSQEKLNQVAGEVNSIGWAITLCQVEHISASIQVYIFKNKSIQNEAILGTDFIHQFQLELRPDLSIHQNSLTPYCKRSPKVASTPQRKTWIRP